MLEVKNLTKVYDDGTVALKNVSFTVPDGEFLVVIGLSGSGWYFSTSTWSTDRAHLQTPSPDGSDT